MRVWLILLMVVLSGCTSRPSNIDNVCTIFEENGGWFNNWKKHAQRTEKEFGVPVPVMMATIWKESAFYAKARPPRKKILGFIPGPRPSNAYGYPQALNSTWDWYRKETGKGRAKRNKFKHAIHFVGWYHDQSARRVNIARNDTHNLYLAYYLGHGGYARGAGQSNSFAQSAARRTKAQADRYATQYQRCR